MSVTIKDRGWNKILKAVSASIGDSVLVGVRADAGEHEDLTMVELAAVHEFGSEAAGVPERAPIQRAFADMTKLKAMKEKIAKGILEGKITKAQGMEILGQWGASEIRRVITEGAGVTPPNAPDTAARKGSDRPLVDTGRLINAYSYKVE